MSCYFRHIDDVFRELGIKPDGQNRKEIDKAVHDVVAVTYKDCSAAWREVKKRVKGTPAARAAFITELKTRLEREGLI